MTTHQQATEERFHTREEARGPRGPRRARRLLLVLGSLAVGGGLFGVSCRSSFDDCELTLSCRDGAAGDGGMGGGEATGGASGWGGEAGAAGASGSGGGGDMGGMAGCVTGDPGCGPEPGVYVSPLGSPDGLGTLEDPISSIGRAAELASPRGLDVLVCSTQGPYQEDLSLGDSHSGVTIRGGFDCDDFVEVKELAEVVAQQALGHRIEGAEQLTLQKLHLRGADAEAPAESSVGLWVVDSRAVRLLDGRVTAGRGAAGADGTPPEESVMSGTPGNPGVDACEKEGDSAVNTGGVQAETACGGIYSIGAKGGPAGGGALPDSGGSGGHGLPDVSGGAAGEGQPTDVPYGVCLDGGRGRDGAPGQDGAPASRWGTLSSSGYTPSIAEAGLPGAVGGGGGGGGGAKKPTACDTGASGGSGGGGGCPGAGSLGGQSGGGSLGIISYHSELDLVSVRVTVQAAGDGGAGANGQAGGSGGPPGAAGMRGDELTASSACAGGSGGDGGRGGAGGGGAGGPQIGVVVVGDQPLQQDVEFVVPKAAPGGPGGLPNAGGGEGPAGFAADVQQF